MSIQAADLRADVSVTGVAQAASGLETVDQSLRKVAASQGTTAASSKTLEGGLGSLSGSVKAAAGSFLAFKGVEFLKGAVSDAAEVNDQIKTTTSLFGPAADATVEWADTTDTALGLSKHATLGMVDSLGTMLRGFQVTAPAAADMSKELVRAAADTAAFKGGGLEANTVLAAFQKGVGGASKGLKQYGIDASASAQAETALQLGISGTAKEWTAAQRAAVFYQLILKGTAQTAGTFADRSGDLTNQQKILSAEWANAKDELASGLVPVASKMFSIFTAGFEAIGPGGLQMVTQIGAITAATATLLAGGEALTKVWGSVSEVFSTSAIDTAQVVLQADELTTVMGAEAAAARAAATANTLVAESGGFVGLSAQGAAASLEAEAVAAESAAASNAALGVAAAGAAGGLATEAVAAEGSAVATVAAGTAAEGAAGGFQLMSLRAAGAIPIYTALAVAAYYLGRTLLDLGAFSTKASLNVAHSTDELSKGLFHAVHDSASAKAALGDLAGATERWFKAQGAAGEQIGTETLRQLGIDYKDVATAVRGGTPAIDDFVGRLHLNEVNAETLRGSLTKLHDSYEDGAEATVRHMRATDALSESFFRNAVSLSTAKDGTVDWIQVLDIVANKQHAVATSSTDLVGTLDSQRQKWNDLTQAIRENTDRLRDNRDGLLGVQGQAISAEQNMLRIADAQKTYNDAVAKYGLYSREAIDAGLAYQALTTSQAISIDSAAASAEAAASKQSGLTDALKAQADAVKKNGADSEEAAAASDVVAAKTEIFRGVLEKYAATVHGPVHDAIITYLANTANLISGTTQQAHAVELSIKKSSGLSAALADQAMILKIVGKDSDAYAAATKTVTAKQAEFREQLLEAARAAAGPVRDKILEYIRTIDSINSKKVTEVAIAGLPVAEQSVARYLVQLGFIPKDKVTLVSVQAAEALHQLGLLKQAVAEINPHVSLVAVTRADAGGRAAGGYVAPGTSVDVGELGRERLTLFPGGGGYVTSNKDLVAQEAAVSKSAITGSQAAASAVSFSTPGLAEARAHVAEYQHDLAALPDIKQTTVSADTAAASRAVSDLQKPIAIPTASIDTPGLDAAVTGLHAYEQEVSKLPTTAHVTVTADTASAVAALQKLPEVKPVTVTTSADIAELAEYSDELARIPAAKRTDIAATGVAVALSDLRGYRVEVAKLPVAAHTAVTAETGQAVRALGELRGLTVPAKTVEVAASGVAVAVRQIRDYQSELDKLAAAKATRVTADTSQAVEALRGLPAVHTTTIDLAGLGDATAGVRDYAGELGRVPAARRTDIETPGLAGATAGVAGYGRELEWIPVAKSTEISKHTSEKVTITTDADTDAVQGYAAAVSAVPTAKETHVVTAGLPTALSGLREYEVAVGRVPAAAHTQITADPSQAFRALADLRDFEVPAKAVAFTTPGLPEAAASISRLAGMVAAVPAAKSTSIGVTGVADATRQLHDYSGQYTKVPTVRGGAPEAPNALPAREWPVGPANTSPGPTATTVKLEVTVNAGVGAHPAAIGSAVVEALSDYVRSSDIPVPIRIAFAPTPG